MAINNPSDIAYLLSLLGGGLAAPGSQLQQMAGSINQLAQRQAYQQYVNRKQVDPGAKAPLGLSPELQMQADTLVQQMQQQKFQQTIAEKSLALQERQVGQAETLLDKKTQAELSLLEKEGQQKMEILKQSSADEKAMRKEDMQARREMYKEQIEGEKQMQAMRLKAQQDAADMENSLRREALDIQKQGGIDSREYQDKMAQVQAISALTDMYGKDVPDDKIAEYATMLHKNFGIPLPTSTSLPAMNSTTAGSVYTSALSSAINMPISHYDPALTENAFNDSPINAWGNILGRIPNPSTPLYNAYNNPMARYLRDSAKKSPSTSTPVPPNPFGSMLPNNSLIRPEDMFLQRKKK